jgi:Flp pilus assembly protein TadD
VLRALPPVRVPRADPTRGLEAALVPTMSAIAIVTNPLLGPATLPVDALPAIAAVRALEQALIQRTFQQQIDGLNDAVARDTAWTLSRVVRAYRYLVFSTYYEDEKTRRAFLAALPAAGVPLSPYEAALRDAAIAVSEGEPERELGAMRRIQRAAPGAFGSAFYVTALEDRNRPREALEHLARIGPFVRDPQAPAGSPLAESGAHWREVAALRHFVGEYAEERIAAERSATLDGTNVATLIRRGIVYAALGDSAAVEEVMDAADVVSAEPRPNAFGGEVQLIVGQELMAHGHTAHGQQVLARALRWFERHRGDTRAGELTPRSDIAFREALALRSAGHDSAALAAVRPLAALNSTDSRFRSFYGRVQGALGNQAAADSTDAWLAQLQQDPAKAAISLSERAFLAAARGRREDAVAFIRESFARGNTFYIRSHLHRFNDWWQFKGYAPFEKILTPDG